MYVVGLFGSRIVFSIRRNFGKGASRVGSHAPDIYFTNIFLLLAVFLLVVLP